MSRNPKGDLIAYCQTHKLGGLEFDVRTEGLDHEPVFTANVVLDGRVVASAQGRAKKDAEKNAAQVALSVLTGEPLEANHFATNLEEDEDTNTQEHQPLHDPHDDEGKPWPIFPEVLAQCLAVANSRVESNHLGENALAAVRDLTLGLYKDLLDDLGEYQ